LKLKYPIRIVEQAWTAIPAMKCDYQPAEFMRYSKYIKLERVIGIYSFKRIQFELGLGIPFIYLIKFSVL